MSWVNTTLGEISANIQTGPFGSQLHQSDYSDEGTPVVMPKDLVNGQISDVSIARVSEDHVNRLSRHKVEVGDILYSRRGDVGRCAFATDIEQGWLCGTGCLRVTIDRSKAIPKFVFYQLQKAETVGWVEKHAVGATMLNLNTSILSSVPIEIPSLAEQQIIVDILFVYDELIENNQKQIKLLEEAAQRLYKEWFVDLRFPGYENTPVVDGVPQGWRITEIGNAFKTLLGGTPSREKIEYWENGTIPWINSGKVNELRVIEPSEYITDIALNRSATKLLPKHTTLVAITGATLGQVSYTEIETCANQSVVGIVDESQQYSEYVYCYVLNNIKNIIGKATGGAQQHINKDIVNCYPIVLPSDDIRAKFQNVVKPIFDKIGKLLFENFNLTEVRDRLLPKLMSGEIEV